MGLGSLLSLQIPLNNILIIQKNSCPGSRSVSAISKGLPHKKLHCLSSIRKSGFLCLRKKVFGVEDNI